MPPARAALALALAFVAVLLGPTGTHAQNVLVAYHTVTGHTRLMAEAVAEGALGEELTQMALLSAMLVYGTIVVGGPEWTSAFGASAVTEEITGAPPPTEGSVPVVEERFLAKGRALGRRVAEVTARLRG